MTVALPPLPTVPVSYEVANESSAPRCVAVIGGQTPSTGARFTVVSYSLALNAHGATDTGTLTLTASNGPDWTQFLFRGIPLANPDLPCYVQIYAGHPGEPPASSSTDLSQLTVRFTGIIDQYSIRMKADRVTFNIRSLAAPLTSDKISVPFQNQTTVDFVKAMAARYNLGITLPDGSSSILVPNKPLTIQQVLQDEFIGGTHNMRIWDLLIQCAIWDDVDVWVDVNGVLNYAAPFLIKRLPLDLLYGRDLSDPEFVHSPQFSKNVQVDVRSYNPVVRQSTRYVTFNGPNGAVSVAGQSRTVVSTPVFGTNGSVTTSYDGFGNSSTTLSNRTGGSVNSGGTGFATESGKQKYIFYVPNLQPQDANNLAQRLWRQISQHEYHVVARFPATKTKLPNIGLTSLVRLHGTPYSAFNTSNDAFTKQLNNPSSVAVTPTAQGGYWPRTVHESFDTTQGWQFEVDMLNHTLPAGAV